jgi:TonB-dependent SusC/RagA subfamily outer membrane receptor
LDLYSGTLQINKHKSTNVTNQLSGKVAGLRVSGSGGAFTGSSVIIRGLQLLRITSLYVVDGVPIDNGGGAAYCRALHHQIVQLILLTEDVESMVVPKDAASTALYGSKGASGVI